MFRIVDWDLHFENNRTRELKRLEWVPIPNKHDGDGFTELLDHPEGEAHYGAWCLLVQVASKCEPRGTLSRDGARPHDVRSLARMTRCKEGTLATAIKRLVSDIGWLEIVPDPPQQSGVTEISQEDATMSHPPAEKRLRKGTEGNGRESPNAPSAIKGARPLGSARVDQASQASPSPINSDNGEGHHFEPDLSEVDWDRVVEIAEDIARKIPPRKIDDRRFWLKFAVMGCTAFPQAWIMDAVEAVMRATKTRKTKQAHLMAVVGSKAREAGYDKALWSQILKSIEIPDHVWHDKGVVEVRR